MTALYSYRMVAARTVIAAAAAVRCFPACSGPASDSLSLHVCSVCIGVALPNLQTESPFL